MTLVAMILHFLLETLFSLLGQYYLTVFIAQLFGYYLAYLLIALVVPLVVVQGSNPLATNWRYGRGYRLKLALFGMVEWLFIISLALLSLLYHLFSMATTIVIGAMIWPLFGSFDASEVGVVTQLFITPSWLVFHFFTIAASLLSGIVVFCVIITSLRVNAYLRLKQIYEARRNTEQAR